MKVASRPRNAKKNSASDSGRACAPSAADGVSNVRSSWSRCVVCAAIVRTARAVDGASAGERASAPLRRAAVTSRREAERAGPAARSEPVRVLGDSASSALAVLVRRAGTATPARSSVT